MLPTSLYSYTVSAVCSLITFAFLALGDFHPVEINKETGLHKYTQRGHRSAERIGPVIVLLMGRPV